MVKDVVDLTVRIECYIDNKITSRIGKKVVVEVMLQRSKAIEDFKVNGSLKV